MSTNTLGHVENPSAKILFTQILHTAPGQCATCGSGQDKNGFCDTQLDFEYYGRVYFCSNCVAEIAAVFGFISPTDYAELEDELNLAKMEKQRDIDRIDHLEEIINGITGLKSLFSNSPAYTLADMETPEQETIAAGKLTEPELKPISEPSGIDESNSGESGSITKPSGKSGFLNL